MFHGHKVWHTRMLYKIRGCFAFFYDIYAIIKSTKDLLKRAFRVKYGEKVTQLKEINSRVPQDSMLGSVLYLLHTEGLPVALGITTAIYVDDTVI